MYKIVHLGNYESFYICIHREVYTYDNVCVYIYIYLHTDIRKFRVKVSIRSVSAECNDKSNRLQLRYMAI